MKTPSNAFKIVVSSGECGDKWQKMLSVLNIPRVVKLHDPKRPLQRSSACDYLTEEEISGILQRKSYDLNRDRLSARVETLTVYLNNKQNIEKIADDPEIIKTWIGSTDHISEVENDWNTASLEFSIDVLEGKVDFIRNIHPSSYYRLEHEWLEDAKRLLAHRRWLSRGRGWGEREKVADYLQVCGDFAQTLRGGNRKAPQVDFTPVENYILCKYLVRLRHKRQKPSHGTELERLNDRLYSPEIPAYAGSPSSL